MTDWHRLASDGIPARPTARVLLLDQFDSALLFCATGSDGQPFWFTPGGGAEPDESPEAAALREIEEETGLRSVKLEREIWRRTVRRQFDGELREIRERWFLARCDRFNPDTSGFNQLELDTIFEHRWWAASELRNTMSRIVPADLGLRLDDLLRDGPPSSPLDITPDQDR